MDGGPHFYISRSAKELSQVVCRIEVCSSCSYCYYLIYLSALQVHNTELGRISAIFINFTQILLRLKGIYEYYIFREGFFVKTKENEEENGEENFQLGFIKFYAFGRLVSLLLLPQSTNRFLSVLYLWREQRNCRHIRM